MSRVIARSEDNRFKPIPPEQTFVMAVASTELNIFGGPHEQEEWE
jgi:hypothetical protein